MKKYKFSLPALLITALSLLVSCGGVDSGVGLAGEEEQKMVLDTALTEIRFALRLTIPVWHLTLVCPKICHLNFLKIFTIFKRLISLTVLMFTKNAALTNSCVTLRFA